jgi:SAM-dependent methyltransferase
LTAKWNEVYLKTFGGMWYPDEGIVRFTARYLKRRLGIDAWDARRKVGRVLDAGCGNGRHVVFLAEQGFDVYGIDISEEAIEIASAWLAKEGLKANLQVGDLRKLPFANDYFDVVISFGVLDHITFPQAKAAFQEIKRACSKGAYLYITLRATEDSECGRGREVDRNTFILQEGYEKGIVQHFFDLGEIEQLLDGFRIFDIECHEERFPDVFTVDKSFLQSSKGEKKFIDLSQRVNLGLKYSRWHIAAEKA